MKNTANFERLLGIFSGAVFNLEVKVRNVDEEEVVAETKKEIVNPSSPPRA